MSDLMYHSEDGQLKVIQGRPKESSTKELSSWKKFVRFILPWLGKKRELGDRFLAAKVINEEANAFKTYAEGMVQLATAKKIAQETTAMENQKLAAITQISFTPADIDAKMAEIEEKMKLLSIVHGGSVTVQSNKDLVVKNIETQEGN
ncbi:MAG: hypothetical protein JKY70_02305 [Mucilaginibacter sp.]|nr:hypothetical protein [Mucilaginibacter sp.]